MSSNSSAIPTTGCWKARTSSPCRPARPCQPLTMWVDGVPIEAKILPAGEARAIYDAIVRQLRDPALLEYVGQDAIQANVFPIPPGEERLIEIEYSHAADGRQRRVPLRLPAVGGVYTQHAARRAIHPRRTGVQRGHPHPLLAQPPRCIDRPTEFSAVVGYEDTAIPPLDDFELYYTVSPEEIGLTCSAIKSRGRMASSCCWSPGHRAGRGRGQGRDPRARHAAAWRARRWPRPRSAARYVIDHLNPEDRFAAGQLQHRCQPLRAGAAAGRSAGRLPAVHRQPVAVGGTNISGALLEAANLVEGAADDRSSS
jgi:Ca-activated chloride channel family protein